jgi:hypothetical protein
LLTTKWTDTGAFKAGILDKDGNVIRKPETSDEKSVYNYFHRLVFNIKRMLNKVPFGKSTIASYLAALYLIKESFNVNDADLAKYLTEDINTIAINESEETDYLHEGQYILKHDIAIPNVGEFLARSGTEVIVEDTVSNVGFIFGYPVFEAFHSLTKSKIYITKEDIQ